MRPLEVELHGFRSYRGATTFDLRGRRLVGIVGPIGSGKSSILDAIAFALYGKTPTFERDTKSLIHQLADTCHVRLRFEVDGEVWEATRALRRKGASAHDLKHLGADAQGTEVLEQVSGDRPVRERVEALLGMAFDAFCRSVLLAQNRFAEFLHAAPGQRNEVLKGVFGYERFDAARAVARGREQLAQATLDGLEILGRELAEAHEALPAAEMAERASGERAERLETARPSLESAEAEERSAAERAIEAASEAELLAKAAGALPDPAVVAEAEDAVEAARAAVAEALGGIELAEERRAAADAGLLAAQERLGDAAFEELVLQQRAAADRVDRAVGSLETRRGALTELSDALEVAAAAASAAEAEVTVSEAGSIEAETATRSAEAALHEAQHDDMARTLRGELRPGEPCPVCQHDVDRVPAAGRAPALAAAKRALERARSREGRARERQRTLAATASTERARAASIARRVEEEAEGERLAVAELTAAEASLASVKSELADRLGEGDPEELLKARRDEVEAARAAATEAVAAVAAARDEKDRAVELGARADRALGPIANAIAAAWGLLGSPHDVSAGDLLAALGAIATTIGERSGAARDVEAGARAAVDAARAGATALRTELGLEPAEDFTAALTRAAAEAAAAQGVAERLRAVLETGDELEARVRDAQNDRDLARRLASDLQPAGFLTYVLAAERAALADLGSVHLDQLTDGAYRFTEDDRFDVLDMNAGGTVRRAASLSGGETFLASLALALALAEMVARGGGRLDAFFLDEGFGSLDPDHLDRAMDGVGRLVAGDDRRLVVLVSHVEQMRQLMEDLIVLDKSVPAGDTVVVSGAGPA
jgi:DNA repair protein SbcC/Rad50